MMFDACMHIKTGSQPSSWIQTLAAEGTQHSCKDGVCQHYCIRYLYAPCRSLEYVMLAPSYSLQAIGPTRSPTTMAAYKSILYLL